jgi:hypothetical protein
VPNKLRSACRYHQPALVCLLRHPMYTTRGHMPLLLRRLPRSALCIASTPPAVTNNNNNGSSNSNSNSAGSSSSNSTGESLESEASPLSRHSFNRRRKMRKCENAKMPKMRKSKGLSAGAAGDGKFFWTPYSTASTAQHNRA